MATGRNQFEHDALILEPELPSERRRTRHVALNLAGHILPLVAALPAIPLLVRYAGTERFGLLTLAWSLIGYLNVLDFGTGRALTQGIAQRRSRVADSKPSTGHAETDIASFVRSGVQLSLSLSLAFAVPLALAAPRLVQRLALDPMLAREAQLGVQLVALGLPFTVLSVVGRGVLEGFEDFTTANAIRMPMGIATFVGPLAVLPFTRNLAALIAGLVAARALGALAYVWAMRRAVRSVVESDAAAVPTSNPAAATRDLLRYGGWITVSNVISPLMVMFDRVAIAAVLGAGMVAYYTAPFEVVHRLVVIPIAIAGVFFPAFAHAWSTPEAPRLLKQSSDAILALVFVPALVLMALAPKLLQLWLGAEFAEAGTPVARLLLLGLLCNAAAQVPFAFVQGAGRPDWTALLHLAELPLYAAALAWALPRYGLSGAAAVWSGRMALDLLALNWLTMRIAPDTRAAIMRSSALLLAVLVAVAGAVVVW